MPRINLSIRIGPMVHFTVQGDTSVQVAEALEGYERLNDIIDRMFSDLASRVYPEGDVHAPEQEGKA